jgi:phasin family protein
MAENANTSTEHMNEHLEKTREMMESGLHGTVQTFRRAADQFTEAFGFAGPQAEELAKRSSQNIEALSQASNVLVKGAQDITREWLEVMQERMAKNLEAMNRFAGCRSLQDFVALQSDIMRDRLGHTIESSRRLSEVSARVANEAAQVIQLQAGRNAGEVDKNLRRVA